MSKTLGALNVLLLAASGLCVAYIVRQSSAPWPQPPAARPRAAAPVPAPAPAADAARAAPPGGYAVVASRNLFSPTRTEAPPPPVTATPAAASLPKPNLYGVVVREQAPIAYLEDPVTKRVAAYRLGDTIAGGTVQAIKDDRVVLARPDGNVDIRLHDPTRPRPAAPATPAAAPGTPPATLPTSPIRPVPPAVSGGPTTPQGDQPAVAPRRPLPPSLLRRLPPAAGGEAPASPSPQH